MSTPPLRLARLTVLLARTAPVGVIFRHGPQKWVRMIRWDTERDEFEPGQWLNGEVHSPDLSPDGTTLIYCANKFRGGECRTHTAISRPPYFTAVAFWPNEDGGWLGGSFRADDHLQLMHFADTPPPLPADAAFRAAVRDGRLRVTTRPFGPRSRDTVEGGWHWVGVAPYAEASFPEASASWFWTWFWGVWIKPNPTGGGTLRREPAAVRPSGLERVTPNAAYEFIDPCEGHTTLLRGASWADWDHRGRLVFARDGKLFAADPSDAGADARELADFGTMRPELIKAPDWASRRPRKSGDS